MSTNTLLDNKHIAMWSCPRSRSTLVTRSFEQLDGCMIFDEPLYAPYLLENAFDHPERELVIAHRETDYQKVIQLITNDLPEGILFSFQKHIAKNILPYDDRKWIKSLDNFFLIRNPQEIILSYSKVCPTVTKHDVGMESLYNLYQELETFTDQSPLVIDSTDLIKNPRGYLHFLCNQLDIAFSENMLSWEAKLETKKDFNNPFPWLWTGDLPPTPWYTSIDNSTGFVPYQEKEINLPEELMPVFEECFPIYQKLWERRQIID